MVSTQSACMVWLTSEYTDGWFNSATSAESCWQPSAAFILLFNACLWPRLTLVRRSCLSVKMWLVACYHLSFQLLLSVTILFDFINYARYVTNCSQRLPVTTGDMKPAVRCDCKWSRWALGGARGHAPLNAILCSSNINFSLVRSHDKCVLRYLSVIRQILAFRLINLSMECLQDYTESVTSLWDEKFCCFLFIETIYSPHCTRIWCQSRLRVNTIFFLTKTKNVKSQWRWTTCAGFESIVAFSSQ